MFKGSNIPYFHFLRWVVSSIVFSYLLKIHVVYCLELSTGWFPVLPLYKTTITIGLSGTWLMVMYLAGGVVIEALS